jgi:hypothetical protein
MTLVVAATVVRANSYTYKAALGDGTYLGCFPMLRSAQALVERSISRGGAPLPWIQQDRADNIELWYVYKDTNTGAFLRFQGAATPMLAATAVHAARAMDVAPRRTEAPGADIFFPWASRGPVAVAKAKLAAVATLQQQVAQADAAGDAAKVQSLSAAFAKAKAQADAAVAQAVEQTKAAWEAELAVVQENTDAVTAALQQSEQLAAAAADASAAAAQATASALQAKQTGNEVAYAGALAASRAAKKQADIATASSEAAKADAAAIQIKLTQSATIAAKAKKAYDAALALAED